MGIPEWKLFPGVPEDTFYLFPRVEYNGMSAREFCKLVLEEHRIAMVPGDVFGGEYYKHVRISYGGDTDTQKKAAGKLTDILNT
jgi:aspartate/methionine/tyrosine aminotransferase